MSDILKHIESREEHYLNELLRLVAQPSISAQNVGMSACAELVAAMMSDAGITARVIETDGAPVVFGSLVAGPEAPTLLIYGHYDVQPPEPLEMWRSPPFEPTLREGRIFGRGVGDNKGQLTAHIFAVQAWQEAGDLPAINLKFFFEGEEEISSRHLPDFVNAHRELLKADAVYIADAGMHPSGPLISFGCRGLLYIELMAKGAAHDAHSGHYGGALPNPAWQLIRLLNSMVTEDQRCSIQGFYEDVLPPTESERNLIELLPHDEARFLMEWELREMPPPKEWSFFERIMFQPTLNICGFNSGYGGQGAKTIIPANAQAKLDIRLVPDQDPDEIWERIVSHVAEHAPNIEIRRLSSTKPSKTDVELPLSRAIIRAVSQVHGQTPLLFPITGGSSPRYVFTDLLGLPTISVPYANHDQNNHSPNENLRIDSFIKGIQTSALVFAEVAKLKRLA